MAKKKENLVVGDRVRFIHGGYTISDKFVLPGCAEQCMNQEGAVAYVGTDYIHVDFDNPELPNGPHFAWRFELVKSEVAKKLPAERLPKNDLSDLII